MRALVVVLAVLCAMPCAAQDRPQAVPPELSEAAASKLTTLELQAEVASLKIALLQAEIQRVQEAFARLASSLEKPGFQLTRSESGVWSYAPAPARPPQEPKP